MNTSTQTHNHWDHASGNNKIKEALGDRLKVIYGGVGDNAQGVTKEVGDGDVIEIGKLKVHVIATPCHTPGHVCYVVKLEDGPQLAFTGDTLFVGGCGNFNSGTPKQMAENFRKLGSLKGDTLVYCGHEYTESNLLYASFVEPDNVGLKKKLEWAKANVLTVPSTILDEHEMNPFMRAAFLSPSLVKHCGTSDPAEAIKFVRHEKSAGAWKKQMKL